jgi:hypothetical protein
MFHHSCRLFRHKARGAAATHILVFVAAFSVARHRRNDAGCRIYLADTMIHRIRNVEIVLPIDYHGFRRMEHSSDCGLVVTVIAIPAHAGHGRDNAAAGIDAADAVTALVDDNNIPFPVHCEPHGIIEPGFERGLSIIEIHRHIQSV